MASNASTESLSEVSELSTETEREVPFDAEDTSDEVATFFQAMTMSTTRRLPAKNANILEGVAPYVYETVKKTTRTLISHSLTPPVQMLIKSRLGRTSTHGATTREEADPASIPPQPQTGTRVSTSSSSAALPGLGYRPKVKVFSDEIPGWPRYPDFPSSNLSGYTATSPPTPFANHAVADGQATPTISAVDLQSPPLPHPEHASLAQTDNQVPLNVSTTVAPQIAPPVSAVRPSVSFATTSGTSHSAIVADTAGSQATRLLTPGYSATTQAAPGVTPLAPSASGSKERLRLIKEAMGEK